MRMNTRGDLAGRKEEVVVTHFKVPSTHEPMQKKVTNGLSRDSRLPDRATTGNLLNTSLVYFTSEIDWHGRDVETFHIRCGGRNLKKYEREQMHINSIQKRYDRCSSSYSFTFQALCSWTMLVSEDMSERKQDEVWFAPHRQVQHIECLSTR
jgi:hypothetical protein